LRNPGTGVAPDFAGYVTEDLSPLIVKSKRLRNSVESASAKPIQQSMDSCGMRTSGAPDRVTDTNDVRHVSR
jgi:hypothetical protein